MVATDAILVPLLPEDITKEDQTHPETGEGPLYPPAVGGGGPLTPLATGGGPLLTDVGQGVIDPVPLGTGGGVLLLIGGTDEGGDTVLRTTRLVGGVALRMRVTVICLRYVKAQREIRRTHRAVVITRRNTRNRRRAAAGAAVKRNTREERLVLILKVTDGLNTYIHVHVRVK